MLSTSTKHTHVILNMDMEREAEIKRICEHAKKEGVTLDLLLAVESWAQALNVNAVRRVCKALWDAGHRDAELTISPGAVPDVLNGMDMLALLFDSRYSGMFKINWTYYIDAAILNNQLNALQFLCRDWEGKLMEEIDKNCCYFAVRFGYTELVRYLVEAHGFLPGTNELDDAIHAGHTDMVKYLMDVVDVEASPDRGYSPTGISALARVLTSRNDLHADEREHLKKLLLYLYAERDMELLPPSDPTSAFYNGQGAELYLELVAKRTNKLRFERRKALLLIRQQRAKASMGTGSSKTSERDESTGYLAVDEVSGRVLVMGTHRVWRITPHAIASSIRKRLREGESSADIAKKCAKVSDRWEPTVLPAPALSTRGRKRSRTPRTFAGAAAAATEKDVDMEEVTNVDAMD